MEVELECGPNPVGACRSIIEKRAFAGDVFKSDRDPFDRLAVQCQVKGFQRVGIARYAVIDVAHPVDGPDRELVVYLLAESERHAMCFDRPVADDIRTAKDHVAADGLARGQ